MHEVTDRSAWSLEALIDHACSLAMGYGAGRDDLKDEFMATKDLAKQAAAALPLADDEWFRSQYPAAVASGNWEHIARVLSGRLRQMDKRAKAANKRADALEAHDDFGG